MTTTLNAQVRGAVNRARQLIDPYCNSISAIDIRKVAGELGVVDIQAVPLQIDGFLARLEDGTLAIRYRAANPESRNRFTIAHELGHILLAGFQADPITRFNREFKRNPAEEKAVSRIGSELLMPERSIAALIRDNRKLDRWELLHRMQHIFRVSESAIVLRMLELWSVGALLFRLNADSESQNVCPNFPVDVSETKVLRLRRDYTAEERRILAEARTCNRHVIEAEVAGAPKELVAEGMWRDVRTKRGVARQYWVIAWTVSEARLDHVLTVWRGQSKRHWENQVC